jgi:hypothetical protein
MTNVVHLFLKNKEEPNQAFMCAYWGNAMVVLVKYNIG